MEKVRARFIVEMLGKPEKALSKALKDLVNEMKKDGRKVENETYSEPKKVGKILFSAFVEFELVLEGIDEVIGAIIDYAPTNVELLEPDKMSTSMAEMQEVLNDLVARLYELDKQVKVMKANNTVLKKKLETIQNN